MIKIKVALAVLALVGLAGSSVGFVALNGRLAQAQPKIGQKAVGPDDKGKAANDEKVYSLVRGQNFIIAIVPNGSRVKKGDVVCELDSAALEDQLLDQQITIKTTEANYNNSHSAREVAELALVEYVEGLYGLELAQVVAEIKKAEAELATSEDQSDAAKADKGGKKVGSARAALIVARYAIEVAQARKKVLTDYTKPKRIKELRLAVEKARSDELIKQSIWNLEMTKVDKLGRQIASCTIVAPTDGTVRPLVGEGAVISERQLLLEIVPSKETTSATK
jgi:multidrug efflux pump subunit AcrA (membrane-fusion protein)